MTHPDRHLTRPGRVAIGVAAAAAVVGGSAYLYTHDPHVAGSYPPCLLYATTGLYCPACGGTRAVYDLLHGDVAGAFARHPLVPLLLVAAVVLGGRILGRHLGVLPRAGRGRDRAETSTDRTGTGTDPTATARPMPNWVPVALGVAVLVFGVLRNIPGWTWLSPA